MTTDDGPPSVAPRATELAELAFRRYGLRDARARPLRQRGRTQVFRVTSPTGGEFVLRMFAVPPAVEGAGDAEPGPSIRVLPRSLEALRSQLPWMSYLRRETDLVVPEPMPASDGSLVNYVSLEGFTGRHCVLLRWVPGRHKDKDLGTEDISLIGSYLARLHLHAERYFLPEGSIFPRWDWDWPFGESAPLWGKGEAVYTASEMGVFEAAAQRVRGDLEELGYGRDAFGLIHRDPNLDNFLFHDGMVGAIDFDLCGLGHYLLDLTVTLISLRRHHRGHHTPRWEAFLAGYESKRPLPPNHKRYFQTFVAMRMVAAVNRELDVLGRETPKRRLRERPRGSCFLSNAVRRLKQLTENDEVFG